MKKYILLLLTIFGLVLSSCDSLDEDYNEKEPNGLEHEVTILTPNGTPYIGLGGLLDEENISITAVNGPDNLKSGLVSGSYDIIVAPVNLGAQLYSKGNSNYKMAAVLTMNNAYIVTTDDNKLDSLDDLANEKVLGFGATGIPGNVLKTLYSQNDKLNVENVDFTYASSSAVYSIFTGDENKAKYALLSQPEIAKLEINDGKDVKTLDLCDLLGVDVPQACVYVNPNSEHSEDVNKALDLIKKNVEYLNEDHKNYAFEIVLLDRVFETMDTEVIIQSLPKMDIVYKEADLMKTEIENILTILGVGLPENEFYYTK